MRVETRVEGVVGGREGGSRLRRVSTRMICRSVGAGLKETAYTDRAHGGGNADGQVVEDCDIHRVLEVLAKMGRWQSTLQFLEKIYGTIKGSIVIHQVLRPERIRQDGAAAELNDVQDAVGQS